MAAPIGWISRAAFLAFLAALALPVSGPAFAQDEQPGLAANRQPTIQIDAEAAVERIPDLAVVMIGVTGEAPDDQTALVRHSENLLRILGTIREAGVAAKDVAQMRPSMEPRYESWIEDGQHRRGARIGFRVTTFITLTLHDVRHAGSVIQAVARSGVNVISGINFKLNDERQASARAEARAEAIALAERLALRSAREAGGSGAHIISVGEPPPPDGQADLFFRGEAESSDRGQVLIIEPGLIKISEKVRAIFRLAR
jgi:uncharacterized protein